MVVPHCEWGFYLNEAKDKCIPDPGVHVPFAFLYAAIIWTTIILWKSNRVKYSKETLVSQILVGLNALYWLGSFILVFLAIPIGYTLF